jgi:hypothetical protein
MVDLQRAFLEDATIEEHGLDAIATSLDWFEKRLGSASIVVRSDSALGRCLQTLRDWKAEARPDAAPKRLPIPDAQRWFLNASGTDYLTKTLHRGEQAGLRGFEDHWRMLSAGNPILTGPAGKPSRERNRTWELMAASWVATFAEDVREAEPDVVCRYHGRQLGLASKVLYGTSGGRFLDIIQSGAEQIQRSNVDAGFVLLNMVEIFPHVAMFRNCTKRVLDRLKLWRSLSPVGSMRFPLLTM